MIINRINNEKFSFLLVGIFNVLITNLILQILLRIDILGIFFPTLISQLFNSVIGYALYGKYVFKAKKLLRSIKILRYYTLASTLWILNSIGIKIGGTFGFSKTTAAFLLIPLLAIISYFSNKWIFKR